MTTVIVPGELISSAVGQGQDMPDIVDVENNITVSIETIILSALIFIGILSWFEFLRSWYDNVFLIEGEHNFRLIWNRFWYAVFITSVVIVLVYILYRVSVRY